MTIGRPPKQMPCEFPTVAATVTRSKGRAIFKVCKHTYALWLRQSGVTPPNATPKRASCPRDFAENAHRTNAELKIRYGCSLALLARFRKTVGIWPEPRRKRPVPDDFVRAAPALTWTEAMKRWKCTHQILTRFCKEAGVRPRAPHRANDNHPIITFEPVDAIVEEAVRHLRRHFPNVYRAEVLDPVARRMMPNAGRGMFVVAGRGALNGSEIVALAEKYGFEREGRL